MYYIMNKRKISSRELNCILEMHERYLEDRKNGKLGYELLGRDGKKRAILDNVDLSDKDLSEIDFSYAFLGSVSFKDCILYKTNFSGAWLTISSEVRGKAYIDDLNEFGTNFTGAYCLSARFIRAHANFSIFDRTDLDFTDFRCADLYASSFRDARFYFTNMSYTLLSKSDFRGTDMSNCNKKYANLYKIIR